MSRANPLLAHKSEGGALSNSPLLLQRACGCGQHTGGGGDCDDCKKKKLSLQRRSDAPAGPMTAPPIVHDVLGSPGQPLDGATRALFEPRFQHDFSQVRVHVDQKAAESARVVGARAYTVGKHIVFAGGQGTQRNGLDRHLLAHELTHVVQQGRSDVDAFQQKLEIGSPDESCEREADLTAETLTSGREPVGELSPASRSGRVGRALDRLEYLPRQSCGGRLQRRLSVDPAVPGNAPANDPARALSSATRFSMMDTLIQSLCPKFHINSSGAVETISLQSMDRNKLATGSNATGCCCLSILTEAPTTWKIEVSSIIGAETNFGSHQVFLNPTNTPVEFGAFTGSNTLAFQGAVPTAGHELCGHAALEEVQAHPVDQDRLRTDVHDPTVRIENQISQEQGVPAAQLRGLAASGSHRGESVDKITIQNFPFNVTDIPASEQSKIKFAAQYIFTPGEQDEYVSILGHSDSVGSPSAKKVVSEGRAQKVKKALIDAGVPPTITKHGLPTTNRFTKVEGMSDSQRPPTPSDADPANWRRAEILMSGFPAGAQTPPAATPRGVAPHTQNPNVSTLKGSPDACIRKLVQGAYP